MYSREEKFLFLINEWILYLYPYYEWESKNLFSIVQCSSVCMSVEVFVPALIAKDLVILNIERDVDFHLHIGTKIHWSVKRMPHFNQPAIVLATTFHLSNSGKHTTVCV